MSVNYKNAIITPIEIQGKKEYLKQSVWVHEHIKEIDLGENNIIIRFKDGKETIIIGLDEITDFIIMED